MSTLTPSSAAAATRFSLLALVAFAAITPLQGMAAPAVTVQLAHELGFEPGQIGTYFSLDIAAFCFATIPSFLWIGRMDARRVALIALATFCGGNLICTLWMPSFTVLLALRAVTALGGGTLMVLCLAAAAERANRDRAYGLWVVGQLVLGAFALLVLPYLFAIVGLRGLYYLLAGLGVMASPLCFAFDPATGRRGKADTAGATSRNPLTTILVVVLSVLCFYIGIGSVWTFAGNVAVSAGVSTAANGTILAVATCFGIAGALLASAIGGKVPRPLVLMLGFALLFLPMVWLAVGPDLIGYSISLFSFKFAWTFALPFLLATAAARDRSGKIVASLSLVIGVGASVGPLFAGWILQAGLPLSSVFLFSLVVTVISALLALRAEALRP